MTLTQNEMQAALAAIREQARAIDAACATWLARLAAGTVPPAVPPGASAWVWPVKGIKPRITQRFNNPTTYGPHEGTDADCYDDATGKLCEIVAVADGRVLAVNAWDGTKKGFQAYGNWVLVQHEGHQARYCHLQKGSIVVAAGQDVKQGVVLGTGDNSGNSVGSHLHLTVTHPDAPPVYIFGQRCVNPETLLPKV